MMNIKDTINFNTLREKGPKAIELEKDEVIQIVSKNSNIKVVISQDYFLKLQTAYNNLLINSGNMKEELVEIDFEEELPNS